MPECHKCPHNGLGHADCLTCKGPPETNHKGRTFVSLDSGEDPQTAAAVEAATANVATGDDGSDIALPPCCADAVRRLLGYLVALESADLSMVVSRVRGDTLADWGRSHGMSRQGAHRRWIAICRRHPELAKLFT